VVIFFEAGLFFLCVHLSGTDAVQPKTSQSGLILLSGLGTKTAIILSSSSLLWLGLGGTSLIFPFFQIDSIWMRRDRLEAFESCLE